MNNQEPSPEELTFQDTDDFYQVLAEKVKQGRTTLVKTQYTHLDQIPPRLTKMLGIDAAQAGALANSAGAFLTGAGVSSTLNLDHLIILGSAATGGGAGALIGSFAGPLGTGVGAAVGAMVGLAVGVATVTTVNNTHTVVIQITADGKLTFSIKPRKQ